MMHLNPRLFAFALALTASACASYDVVSRGWIGDTADHLVEVRGKPDHIVPQSDGSRTLYFYDVFYLAQPAPVAMPAIPHGPTMSAPMTPAPNWGAVANAHGLGPMSTQAGPSAWTSASQSAAWTSARMDYDSQVSMASMANSANAATPTPTSFVVPPAPRASGNARPCRTSFAVDATGIVRDVQFAGPGCTWPVGKLLDARYFPIPRTTRTTPREAAER